MATKPGQPDLTPGIESETAAFAADLDARYGHLPAEEIIAVAIDLFRDAGGIAATSSFGADSAALLHLIAEAEPGLPVTFLDTGQHFGETLDYRDQLADDLGLTNIVVIAPLDDALATGDPDGLLHRTDIDGCCAIRKVEPMARAVAPYRAWFTGRKRGQAATRADMPVFEAVGPRIRVNPLARWTTEDQAAYMVKHDLRQNPLVAFGYLSIGCFPCTTPVKPGEDARSGRWAGQAKTECGIHLPGLETALAPSQ
ncbi:phosphoadenylyl-sulfate reductase [Nitratireductor pacificus]|uniref:Adenosine 5'-phosphosulfate reductase n=1 Tax=Nitratireductor pacificus pht-3B TaxID=391937 RepID=K2MQC2_9HYPH|nr:phosphoadenylyl-sulfate reductase [Nitratireductor pacificus]EKF19507.1 phosphoadenosine phosphosulfate reductase [Nitratireductor pacificus pht-3B]